MRYYKDENGNKVARDLIEIQYLCRKCKTTFWSGVTPLEEMTCPNEACGSAKEVDKTNNSINIFTVRENSGAVKLPYRFRYPAKKKGFIPLSLNLSFA